MKKNKLIPTIITIATVLYMLTAPLLYQNYVKMGINENVTGISLFMLGAILFFVSFLSWATSDNGGLS